ncbi:DEAD/DEAH box helicase family protein [Sphingobium sp. TomTYG45]
MDEAHSCVGGDGGKSKHQRYELLQRLAGDEERHMLFLTATPHSGDEDAYDRLLGLIHPDFALGPEGGDRNARERYAYRLQQHFVQRRRADVEEDEWDAAKAFPKHYEDERTYTLTGEWGKFQEDVLDYCVGLTEGAGDNAQKRRMAFWSTLALMRCIGSSPAAAHQALVNRMAGLAAFPGSGAGGCRRRPLPFTAQRPLHRHRRLHPCARQRGAANHRPRGDQPRAGAHRHRCRHHARRPDRDDGCR